MKIFDFELAGCKNPQFIFGCLN